MREITAKTVAMNTEGTNDNREETEPIADTTNYIDTLIAEGDYGAAIDEIVEFVSVLGQDIYQ